MNMQSPPDFAALSRDVDTYSGLYPAGFDDYLQNSVPTQVDQIDPLDSTPPTIVTLSLSAGKNLRAEPTPTAPIIDVSSQGQFLVESYAFDTDGSLWFFGTVQGQNGVKVWISSTVFATGELQRNAGQLANVPPYRETSDPLPLAPPTTSTRQSTTSTSLGSGNPAGAGWNGGNDTSITPLGGGDGGVDPVSSAYQPIEGSGNQLLIPTTDPNIFEIESAYAAELQETYNIIGFNHPQLPSRVTLNLNTGDAAGFGAMFGSKFPVNNASCLIGRTRLGEPWGIDDETNTAYFNCITINEIGQLVYIRVHFAELTGRYNVRMLFAPGDMPLNSESALRQFFDGRFPPGANNLRYVFGALVHDADPDTARLRLRSSQTWMANLAAQGQYVFPSYSMSGE